MLTLPIKKKWFDLILAGVKKEEYREIKPYYTSRFRNVFEMHPYSYIPSGLDTQYICFRNGYSNESPMFIAKCSLDIKKGREEWGAKKDKEYYVLTIHKIISTKNMGEITDNVRKGI